MSEFEKYEQGINKTGFILEYKVSKLLEKHKWNIINNRYYIDAAKECEREIDIIAYKAKEVNNVAYYTTLIISCKKSEEEVWAFLTKDINKEDPNIEPYPIANWTNNKVIKFMLSRKDISNELENSFSKKNFLDSIYNIKRQVFAFQQLKKSNGAPQNDKKIYDSIITSINAQEYEISSLQRRKKIDAFYNFNILSILDGEMIEIYYHDENPTIRSIEDIRYLNRHIVNDVESYYRVDFTTFSQVEKRLDFYDKLFAWNKELYSSLVNEYYNNLFEIPGTLEVFSEDFEKDVLFYINLHVEAELGKNEKIEWIYLFYYSEERKLGVGVNFSTEIIDFLNGNEYIIDKVKSSLLKWYKYEGEIVFEEGVPF